MEGNTRTENRSPHSPSGEILHWVNLVRVVLSVCLIYYHTHRLVDSYRYNLGFRIPDEYFTLQSLIKASQRFVLQAGLNLFMAVAGISAYFTLRKRRTRLFQIAFKRSWKLLVGFIFGMIVVAIPSNVIIMYCEMGSWAYIQKNLVALLSPGHIAFLPYLFILSQILVPLKATVLNCHEVLSTPQDALGEVPARPSYHSVPATVRLYALVWTGVFVSIVMLGVDECTWVLGLLFLLSVVFHGIQPLLRAWQQTVGAIHYSISRSRNGAFITIYTFGSPLLLLACTKFLIPHMEFSSLGSVMVFVVPTLSIFWPKSFRPFGDRLPSVTVNTSLMALTFIIFGQLLTIAWFERLPMFTADASPERFYWIEQLSSGVIAERTLMAIYIMATAHAAYYLFGYFLILYRKDLPSPPLQNFVFLVFMCIFYISIHTLSFSPSKDFFYITPGYVTYRDSTRRFWFHFGGWGWVITILIGLRFLGNHPPDGNTWDAKLIRFLLNNTFGTFFIHPLFGYLLCCLLRETDLHIIWKIILLDVGVYVLSYAWSHYMQKIPAIRSLFGGKP